MKKAVSEISSKTIFNCWQHCNILNGESSVDSNVNKVNELNLEEIQSGLNLIKKRINLEEFAFTAKEFVEEENNISTGETLSVEDIVFLATEEHKNAVDDEQDRFEEEINVISETEAKGNIDEIIYFLEQRSDFDYRDIDFLKKLKDKIIFSKTNYVQKKLNFDKI